MILFNSLHTIVLITLSLSLSHSLSLQLANPDLVEGLVLINIDTNARGWIDWAAQKVRLLLRSSLSHVTFTPASIPS